MQGGEECTYRRLLFATSHNHARDGRGASRAVGYGVGNNFSAADNDSAEMKTWSAHHRPNILRVWIDFPRWNLTSVARPNGVSL